MKKQKNAMKIEKGKVQHKTGGITLIALVVTIVVLLILAGITINMVFSDNGTFNTAKNAGDKYSAEAVRDQIEPIRVDWITKKLTGQNVTVDDFFNSLINAGIIDEDGKDNNPTTDANGNTIYEITTNDGYTVEIILDTKGNITIGEIVKGEGLPAKIREIKVLETTKNSIKVKVETARVPAGASIKYYYKLTSSPEDSSYTEVINVTNGEATITGLTENESYTIKATIEIASQEPTTATKDVIAREMRVTEITLNKTTASMMEGKSNLVLEATVLPDYVENTGVTWSSSDTSVAEVDQSGKVTAKQVGSCNIIATSKDESDVTASCSLTVTEKTPVTIGAEASDWELMHRIATAIAKDINITSNSPVAEGETEEGEYYKITVGQTFNVKYGEDIKPVRVLGFKHDDLVNQNAYGEDITVEKASITFDFVESIGNSMYMNQTDTNIGSWATTKVRKELNGYTSGDDSQSGALEGLGTNLSNKTVIKQVKKQYIKEYGNASSVNNYTQDYLWLLSCAEIVQDGYKSGGAGFAIAKEGEQYPYYKMITTDKNIKYNMANSNLVKAYDWWLRSPYYGDSKAFCDVLRGGDLNAQDASSNYRVKPGFCI